MKDLLRENDNKLLEVNRKIRELKTELILLESQQKDLYKEHNQIVMELQYRLNEKERGGRK